MYKPNMIHGPYISPLELMMILREERINASALVHLDKEEE